MIKTHCMVFIEGIPGDMRSMRWSSYGSNRPAVGNSAEAAGENAWPPVSKNRP